METRTINRAGSDWMWPAYDTELVRVFDMVQDIQFMLPHVPVKERGICVQAGGACGVWPLEFSKHFETVVTFEPDPLNFHCLQHNVDMHGGDNVVIYQGALSDREGTGSVKRDDFERTNCGATYFVQGDGHVRTTTIDATLQRFGGWVGLIQLDVEGFELPALIGARETIARCKPCIIIEEKKLPHMKVPHTAARQWLEREFGYCQVATHHRDVVMTCRDGEHRC